MLYSKIVALTLDLYAILPDGEHKEACFAYYCKMPLNIARGEKGIAKALKASLRTILH